MKKSELQPTPENIRSTFLNDTIKRNQDVISFVKLIDSINESYSIAIDSQWGSGKTFFVKQVEMALNSLNDTSYNRPDQPEEIANLCKRYFHSEHLPRPHVALYYDAWKNDLDDDPLYSLLLTITEATDNQKALKDSITKKDIIKTLGKIAGTFGRFNPDDLAENLYKGDILEPLRERRQLDDKISQFIDSLFPEHGERMLIIIDELDRCNPQFAVRLLERIKHYFNNDKITFVFAVNIAELQNTIRQFYGSNFDGARYLDRFFDFRVSLPQLNDLAVRELLSFNNRGWVYEHSLHLVMKKYQMQLREISRFLDITRKLAPQYTHNTSYESNLYPAKVFIIQAICPMLFGLKVMDIGRYHSFVNGRDSSPWKEYFNNKESIETVHHYLRLIAPSERQHEYTENDKEELYEQFDKFYQALLGGSSEIHVGECTIGENERRFFNDIISGLSPISKFTEDSADTE